MPLFHRDRPPAPPAPPPGFVDGPDVGDSPEEMREVLRDLEQTVNAAAGRLPNEATVAARRVTDVLGEILDTAQARPLDIHTVVSVRQTLDDYLPSTVRSYLAVDPGVVDVPRPSGASPRESLLEQLTTLESSVRTVLTASREQDADTLLTQGSFLATKFGRTDLDL